MSSRNGHAGFFGDYINTADASGSFVMDGVAAATEYEATFEVAAAADDGRFGITAGSFSNNEFAIRFGNNSGSDQNLFLRFTNVTIPQGATIEQSYLQIRGTGDVAGPVPQQIMAVDADDASQPGANGDITGADKTTATVDWTIESFPAAYNNSSDITAVIQEIVSREGWASGNAMMILVPYKSWAFNKWVDCYCKESSQPAKLYVKWLA